MDKEGGILDVEKVKRREVNLKCPKCRREDFTIESTIIITEIYKIYKNGRVSDHPTKTDHSSEYMADNDNIIRCKKCNAGYVIPYEYRNDLLRKIDFSEIDLEKLSIKTEF